jgi:hypothetical protein
MVDNQHKRITGYRDLKQTEIDAMNAVKATEQDVAVLWRDIAGQDEIDGRWLAIARTHFQEGFSAMVRSIAQPADPFDGTAA